MYCIEPMSPMSWPASEFGTVRIPANSAGAQKDSLVLCEMQKGGVVALREFLTFGNHTTFV